MREAILDTKLVCDIKGEFFVPSYQRGYRWNDEVRMLLDDIYKNGDNSYCLQPIVVKNNDEQYELIDGQQRLTTIYLIYQYASIIGYEKPQFSISYETRDDSQVFLENITTKTEKESAEYIDFYFMYNAFRTISKWFEDQSNGVKNARMVLINKIMQYFQENVKIIWYEVVLEDISKDSKEESIALFTRLNIGRIPLTNAELVRALFLCRNNEMIDSKQIEISTQWDAVERELRNDEFWYFLTNNPANLYPTRIELIFDMISGKENYMRDKFHTFYFFDNKIKNNNGQTQESVWKEIIHYFLTLKEWYENRNLYHKIGYLIASNEVNIEALMNEAKGLKKNEFEEKLDYKIADSITINKEYLDLSYEQPTDYPKIERILLLFNVESIRMVDDNFLRYPFNKHKTKDWTLEHIHAQNSDGLNKKEQWAEWLRLHIISLNNLPKSDEIENLISQTEELLKNMESVAKSDEVSFKVRFSALYEQIVKMLSEDGDLSYLHTLSNMALLNNTSNSALNSSTFDVKRNKIIEMDKQGAYIPFCTKMVFLKYYTESQYNQLNFWGLEDRKSYISAINTVLKPYLEIVNKSI